MLIWLLRKIIIFWNPTWCLTGGKSILIYFSGAIYSINIFPCPCQLFQLLTGNSIRNEILLEGGSQKVLYLHYIENSIPNETLEIFFLLTYFSFIVLVQTWVVFPAKASFSPPLWLQAVFWSLFLPFPRTPCPTLPADPLVALRDDSPKDALEALPNLYFTK